MEEFLVCFDLIASKNNIIFFANCMLGYFFALVICFSDKFSNFNVLICFQRITCLLCNHFRSHNTVF